MSTEFPEQFRQADEATRLVAALPVEELAKQPGWVKFQEDLEATAREYLSTIPDLTTTVDHLPEGFRVQHSIMRGGTCIDGVATFPVYAVALHMATMNLIRAALLMFDDTTLVPEQ